MMYWSPFGNWPRTTWASAGRGAVRSCALAEEARASRARTLRKRCMVTMEMRGGWKLVESVWTCASRWTQFGRREVLGSSVLLPDTGCGVGCGIRNFDPMQSAEEEFGYTDKK
jgi:hypothetical protein